MRSNAMRLDGWKLAVAIMATALVGMTICARNAFPAVCANAPEFWCVEDGDRVSDIIAPQVGLSVRIIRRMNPEKDLNWIYPGDKLRIRTDTKTFAELLQQEKAFLLEEIEGLRKVQQGENTKLKSGLSATNAELETMRTTVAQLEDKIKELVAEEEERARLEAEEAKKPLAVTWRFIKKNWQALGLLTLATILVITLIFYQRFLGKRKSIQICFTFKDISYVFRRPDVSWRGNLLAFEKRDGQRLAYPLTKISLFRRSVIDSITKDQNLFRRLWQEDRLEVADKPAEIDSRPDLKIVQKAKAS